MPSDYNTRADKPEIIAWLADRINLPRDAFMPPAAASSTVWFGRRTVKSLRHLFPPVRDLHLRLDDLEISEIREQGRWRPFSFPCYMSSSSLAAFGFLAHSIKDTCNVSTDVTHPTFAKPILFVPGKPIEPYFGRHHERDVYTSRLEKTDPPAPDYLLKAALMRRAVTDLVRLQRLREDKPALQNLLQKGSVGDDLWNSLLAAERETEAEILETLAEANTFVDGWGTLIFQTATELLNAEKLRNVVESMDSIRIEKGLHANLMPRRIK